MFRLFSLLGLILMLSTPASAQQGGYGGYGGYGGDSGAASARITNSVVASLQRGIRQCQRLDNVYRYDCYRQNYQSAARKLKGREAYAPAYKALKNVEATLTKVVSQNGDRRANRIRQGTQVFTPIKPAATARAKATFRAALDANQTQLLRSASNTQTHLVRIAAVLDSDKVLLRS